LKQLDLRPVLGKIAAPTLVIVGGAEGPPLQAAAQALVAGIAGARLAVIDGAGHLSAADHPAEFAALVEGFLAPT
jgi:3-oxoadipate enol-lactonase